MIEEELSKQLSEQLCEELGPDAEFSVIVVTHKNNTLNVGLTTHNFPTCHLQQAGTQISELLNESYANGCG